MAWGGGFARFLQMPRVFTYGPDALQGKMFDRIGPTDFVGPARLSGHRLVFDKPNMKNPEEGLVNVQPDPSSQVAGAVFEISRKQMELLDGFFGGYQQAEVEVLGPDETAIRATTWTARRTKPGLRPSREALEDTRKAIEENGSEGVELPDFDPLPDPTENDPAEETPR